MAFSPKEQKAIRDWYRKGKKKKKHIKKDIELTKKWGSYPVYLLSPEWKELRNIKLKEANYHCQICSSKEFLNVHHNNYKRIFHEKLSDLVVLCGKCHDLFHSKLPAK